MMDWRPTVAAVIGITIDQAKRMQRLEDRVARLEGSCETCKHWEWDENVNVVRGVCARINDQWLGFAESQEYKDEMAHIEPEPGDDYPRRLETKADFYCSMWEKKGDGA